MIDIELRGLKIHPDGPEVGWTGLLVAEELPIARVANHETDVLRVVELAEGRTDRDMDAVRVALTEESPQYGAMALGVRCSELIAWECMRLGVGDMLSEEAMGIVGEGPGAELRAVVVPEGGSIEGAISYLRDAEPGIRILNDMDLDAAVEAWLEVAAA